MSLNTTKRPVATNSVLFGEQKPVASFLWIELLTAAVGGGLAFLLLHPAGDTAAAGTPTSASQTLSIVFFHPPPEAKIVICVLLAMTAYTLARLSFAAMQLRQEENDLRRCRRILERLAPDSPVAPDVPVSANTTSGREAVLARMLSPIPAETTLVRAVQAVWNIHRLQSPDLEAVSSTLVALEESRSSVSVSMGNRLLLVSLLGTIVGLARVVSALQPQLAAVKDSGDVQGILDGVQGTLTQMGTAFSSTAWGIVLATTVSWLSGVLSERRRAFLGEVQYFAVSELAPRILPGAVDSAMEQVRRTIADGRELITDSYGKLVEAQERQEQSLQIQQEALEKSARFLIAIENTFHAAANSIHHEVVNAGNFVIEGARAQIDVATQLDNLLQQTSSNFADAAGELSNAARTIQRLDATVKQVDSAVTRVTDALGRSGSDVSDALTLHQNLWDAALAQQQQQFDHTLAQQRRESEAAANRNEHAYATALAEMSRRLTDVTEEIRRVVERTETRLPSAQDWECIQQTLLQASATAESFSEAIMMNGDNLVAPLLLEVQAIHQELQRLGRQISDLSPRPPEQETLPEQRTSTFRRR
jgi:hypothetical protein